jgi:hypothetical protein
VLRWSRERGVSGSGRWEKVEPGRVSCTSCQGHRLGLIVLYLDFLFLHHAGVP